MRKAYTVKYRRKREGKTDYQARLKLLASRRNRIVVRKMLNNISVQFVKLEAVGDKTLVSAHTRELVKLGWNGHKGNVPSAYLVGYLCGLKAKKNGLKDGVLDLGLARVVKGSTYFGAAKGLIDSGINVKCSDEILPSNDVITGKTIADYAKNLASNKEIYLKQFGKYLKNNIKPEELPKHFEEVKRKITEKWQ